MQYQTRRLIAAEPMRHDGRELKPGDEFDASEVDARYLVSQLRAREVQDKVARVAAAPVAAPPVETKAYSDGATATGTPPLPEQSPEQQDAEEPADAEQPAEDAALTTDDAGKPAAPRGRRASPHTNTGTRRRT